MYQISKTLETLLRRRTREWIGKLECNGKEYDASYIVDFSIKNDIVSSDDFEIGAVITSEMTITLNALELPSGAEIKPYVALSLKNLTWQTANFPWEDSNFPWLSNNSEWIPLGTFYVDNREQKGNRWEYKCVDSFIYTNNAYISSLSYPADVEDVFEELCDLIGVEVDESITLMPYTFNIAPTGYTIRQVLSFIASMNVSSCFIGKNGKLKFKTFKHDDQHVFDVTLSDYKNVIPSNQKKGISKLHFVLDEETESFIDVGTGSDYNTLTIINPYINTNLADDILDELDGLELFPCSIDLKGYPHLEVGDVIEITRDIGTSWKNANKPWQEMDVPWNGLVKTKTIITSSTIKFSGGVSMTVESKAKSEQQSEINVEGSISGKIRVLNQTAVKETRTYHGVSINRDFGIKIDRSDNKFGAILNSDSLKFTANGSDALYFDIPSNQYKFVNGRIEAAEFITNPGDYPRVEILSSENVLTAYKSFGSYYQIEADPNTYTSPLVKHTDGFTTMFSGVTSGAYFTSVLNGEYNISTDDDFRVTATSSVFSSPMQVNASLVVTAGGTVTVNSASHLYLGTLTLQALLNTYVPLSTYNSRIAQIESRLAALE